jgi:hypothetical protein
MCEIMDTGAVVDEDVLRAIINLTEQKRDVQLPAVALELERNNIKLVSCEYENLFKKLCSMMSRGLLFWSSGPKTLGAHEQIRITENGLDLLRKRCAVGQNGHQV